MLFPTFTTLLFHLSPSGNMEKVVKIKVPEEKLSEFLHDFNTYLTIKETSEIPTYILHLLLKALKHIAENSIVIIQDKEKSYIYYMFIINFASFEKTLIYTVEDEFDMFTPEQVAKLLKMKFTVKTYDCLEGEECAIKPIVYLITQDDYSLYPSQLKSIREIL